jgi:hypothetical protein
MRPLVRVGCRGMVARVLWLLGYPEQALARLHEALALAHTLAHPFSLAAAQGGAAMVYQCRRDVPAVHEQAEAAVALATAQGSPQWAAWGTSLRGQQFPASRMFCSFETHPDVHSSL